MRKHDVILINRHFIPAMEAIAKRGGWCIRFGDTMMKSLPPMKNVIDYAHSSAKSDWMDIFLSSTCRFFLGSNSGMSNVAHVFGIPCAFTNCIPSSVFPYGATSIGIPKLIYPKQSKRFLNFTESLDSPMGKANYFVQDYKRAGIDIVDNSPEDIRDLAMEMLDWLDGSAEYSFDDKKDKSNSRASCGPDTMDMGPPPGKEKTF